MGGSRSSITLSAVEPASACCVDVCLHVCSCVGIDVHASVCGRASMLACMCVCWGAGARCVVGSASPSSAGADGSAGVRSRCGLWSGGPACHGGKGLQLAARRVRGPIASDASERTLRAACSRSMPRRRPDTRRAAARRCLTPIGRTFHSARGAPGGRPLEAASAAISWSGRGSSVGSSQMNQSITPRLVNHTGG